MNKNFIDYFWRTTQNNANMSKDHDTKVGAVIFSEKDKVEVSSGWNDLPRGVAHLQERNQRPLKYLYTLHGEANAIINAARMGRSTNGMSIMTTMYPCSICTGMIINAGITCVYSPRPDFSHEKYGQDMKLSQQMFSEAGVTYVYLEE